MGAAHRGLLDGGGACDWLGGACWDGADLTQRVNNLAMSIGPRVVFGWCHSAAPCLTGSRISTVLYFWDGYVLWVLLLCGDCSIWCLAWLCSPTCCGSSSEI